MQLDSLLARFHTVAAMTTPTVEPAKLSALSSQTAAASVPSAVLVPFWADHNNEAQLLLTKRALTLRHHPGQISFPGGRVDANDSSVIATALRETEEELAIAANHICVHGVLPAHITRTGFTVYPVLATLKTPFATQPNPGEVDAAFSLPWRELSNPNNWQEQWISVNAQHYRLQGYPCEQGLLWGATAAIIKNLMRQIVF